MIFDKLFKPKWQHKDSSVRIEAIETLLSVDQQDNVETLKWLVENDEVDLVRRAALIKLNAFEEWLNAAQFNSCQKTKAFAEKKVENIVFGQDKSITLSVQQKFTLLDNALKPSFIEAWLNVEDDPNLIITLYEKLEKPQYKLRTFAEKATPAVQSYLVEATDDVATLEKMLKKACADDVASLIQQRITAILEEANKPKVLTKKTQLTLSKLLALREESDYEVMLAKRANLEKEWLSLVSDFDCLDNANEFEAKYSDINAQLDKVFSHKAEAYEQEKIAKQLAKQKQQQYNEFLQKLEHIQSSITDAIFENVTLDNVEVKQQLGMLSQSVKSSSIDQEKQEQLIELADSLVSKLDNLSEIAASVTQATHLIAKASQLSHANELSEFNEKFAQYSQWQKQWQSVVEVAEGYLPQAVLDAHKQIAADWQSKSEPFRKEQQKLFHVVKKKFADINRLINSGKFNAVFGIFKKASRQYSLLSERHQQSLKKELDKFSEKIDELSDWEHYVATPKKQKLLEDVIALAETPLDNPVSQSNKVKEYRKLWNSFGHAEDDLENELNDAFNQACEKAFEPCRKYFAEQEKIREKNLAVKQAIIEEAQVLAKELADEEDKALDTKLNKLKQRWRQSGDIDRKRYLECKTSFEQAIAPIKSKVYQYHQDNATAKQALIAQAKQALAMDDVFEATNIVKGLQKAWASVGYSGVKFENDLWHSFRQVNDQVFAKRDIQKQQDASLLQTQVNDWQAQLDELLNIAREPSIKVFDESLEQLNDLLYAVKSNKHSDKQLINKIYDAIEQFKSERKKIKSAQQKLHWQTLFGLLADTSNASTMIDENERFEQLPTTWQKKLLQANKKVDAMSSDNESRQDKLLKLEVLAGVESPKALHENRMKVQVALMQEQMTSGSTVDLTQLLFDWLTYVDFSTIKPDEIERLQKIYVNK
ncbi:DUF349 domain-containing protein [Thalassotalea fusca]